MSGTDFKGKIKFEFNNGCEGITVEDPMNSYGRSGGRPSYWSGHNQKDFRVDDPDHPMHDDASIFGATGCRATKVTLYYNK